MDTLMSLRVFCAVAELKSFTAAAERLGLSPAMASKHVMHLENRLGTRLLNRTSRHVSPTETGMLYFNQTRQMLYGLDEVEAAVSNATVMPRGTLKLSAPVWIANTVVVQMIAEYHKRYPDVCFDMDLSGQIVNLVDEGFDLALRAIAPEKLDPGYVARPLTKIFFHLVGSPSYLARAGQPTKLADLNNHSMLLYNNINYNSSLIIGGLETLQLQPVMQSENETMLHMAALEGMGLVFLPTLMVQRDITEGRLKMVLPDLVNFHSILYAVYPSRKYLSAKVRTFIDFFSSTFHL
ncbi:LysR family transcriptional regulator [Serratia liquefaciens]|uniref:LysR family transcriptional regulator n=1 Tax=Serratia liquefaciens TaxID=614 RepID=UPI002182A6DA|nr:LysR family transcriptional regulator [Serratia liquefaciens]CAI2535635.1 D-malate degradation protein R [Serratia liquefaciens]